MPAIKPLTGNAGDFSGIVLKAAARGHIEAVHHYLSINPQWLNQEGPHGRTLLWEAVYKGRRELVADLISLGANVNPLGSYYTPMLVELSALAVAREAGHTELVELLEGNGAVDDLYAACHRGDLEAINAFLSAAPETVNRPARDTEFHPRMGYHPIHYAVVGRHHGAVKLLVGSGATVAEHLPLLIDWANGDTSLIKYLKSQSDGTSRRPTSQRNTRKSATRKSPVADVPAIDRPDWMGFPLLVDACRGNHNAPDNPDRVLKLLKRGANVNITDHKQKTPLHRSCQAGFVKITTLLLKHGALLEATDEDDRTPIFDAALHGRTKVVQLLLERSASLSHKDRRGETPLFASARGARVETFEALLEAGADPSLKNNRGKSISEVVGGARAQTASRKQLLKILKRL